MLDREATMTRSCKNGREATALALGEIKALLGDTPVRRDLLVEYLHVVQDHYGCLGVDHLVALAEFMRIPQAEVYEVATFYAYFDVVKETDMEPPEVTIRICDSLTCAMFGAEELMKEVTEGVPPTVRIQRARGRPRKFSPARLLGSPRRSSCLPSRPYLLESECGRVVPEPEVICSTSQPAACPSSDGTRSGADESV